MGIDIFQGNNTNEKMYCIQAKKIKKWKHTSNSSCLIKCTELSASIVTSVISLDGLDHIIEHCQDLSHLQVFERSVFENKKMLTCFMGKQAQGNIPFTTSHPIVAHCCHHTQYSNRIKFPFVHIQWDLWGCAEISGGPVAWKITYLKN